MKSIPKSALDKKQDSAENGRTGEVGNLFFLPVVPGGVGGDPFCST